MDSIVLVDMSQGAPREAHSQYHIAETLSLQDHVRNYDVNTDCVTCPVTLEDVPVDDAIIATCCWQGYHGDTFLKLVGMPCPLCRGTLTQSYITIRFVKSHPSQQRPPTTMIGVDLRWSIRELVDRVFAVCKIRIVRIAHHLEVVGYDPAPVIFTDHWHMKLHERKISNATPLVAWIASDQ